jgi:hypothetical protein
MSAPYFPTPGKQEVLDSLPIPTDDNIPKLQTPSPLPAVPVLLVTDQVTPLLGSITAEILESTDTPSDEHPGRYFIEATQLPSNHPSIVIEHEGQLHFLKYVKYGLVNNDPCILGTDGKGHDIYYTPLHAVPHVEGQYEQHHPPIDESNLNIVLEDYIFNVPLQVAIHNLYNPGICTEVHHLCTTTSRMVGLRAVRAHLQEFQELIQIQLDVHNQQVEGMANQIIQIEKQLVEAKAHSRLQTELDVLAANGLFPGVFAPYHSEHPHDCFIIATPPCYIPIPATALSSLSLLMSVPSSPPSLPAPLPVPIPVSSIFTQAQNPHVVHMPLLQDAKTPPICHSHIDSCDDHRIFLA